MMTAADFIGAKILSIDRSSYNLTIYTDKGIISSSNEAEAERVTTRAELEAEIETYRALSIQMKAQHQEHIERLEAENEKLSEQVRERIGWRDE